MNPGQLCNCTPHGHGHWLLCTVCGGRIHKPHCTTTLTPPRDCPGTCQPDLTSTEKAEPAVSTTKAPDHGDAGAARKAHGDPQADFEKFAAFRSRLQTLTDLELLTAMGYCLNDVIPYTSTMAIELLVELEARVRLDELRKAAPRIKSDRLNDAALTISEKAQEVVAALGNHQLTAAEANTALYALQIAASALRQMQPPKPRGRPTKDGGPPAEEKNLRGKHLRGKPR